MTAGGAGRSRGRPAAAGVGAVTDAGGGSGDRPHEDVMAVVEQVRKRLGAGGVRAKIVGLFGFEGLESSRGNW